MEKARRNAKKLIANIMIMALVLAYIPAPAAQVNAASNKVSTKMYTISKKAGTYSATFKITIKAKKGYKVYYTTGSNLSVKKVIKSGKKKTLTIKKTTTLKIYAVKKSTKITAKKLKKNAVKKKTKSYKYVIKTATDTTNTDTTTSDNTTNTTTDTTTTDNNTDSGNTSDNSGGNNSGSESSTNTVTVDPGNGGSSRETAKTHGSISKDNVSINDSDKEAAFTATSSSAGTDESTGITTETVTDDNGASITKVTVNEAGSYILGGYAENLHINVNAVDSDEEIILNIDGLVADNSGEKSDDPVINIADDNAVISITGNSKIIGASDYISEPAAIISASDVTVTLKGEADAVLDIVDSMAVDKEYVDSNNKEVDPSDGITAGKGELVFESGTYNIYTNGDCVKGTGKKGKGGVTVKGGTLNLVSYLGNGIKSKNGVITISGGTVNTNYTCEDGINAKNYAVNITGGSVNIDYCYGDGIQGEEVNISGGTVDIATYYEYAGRNFYDSSASYIYNTLKKNGDTTKIETVNYDTGSHKGIKAGTKEKTYSYSNIIDATETDDEGNALVAGKTYTKTASGGLTISGGDITINTTKTGIKYNGSAGGQISGSGGNSSGSGNSGSSDSNSQVAAITDGGDVQYIIGCPEDGIKSNNTTVISGGNIIIYAADDGIASVNSLDVTGNAVIDIKTAYEGIESGNITVGTSGASEGPSISLYTNDDGINAAKKTLTYVYTDENEETYTKTAVSSSTGNNMTVYSGSVNVTIGDDKTHTVSLPNQSVIADTDLADTTITYSSDGDGIDCNGSFYALGGTVVVFGSSSGSNSPIDANNTYKIGEGATVLEVGSNSMGESVTEVEQAYIKYGGGSSMGGGNFSGGNFGGNSFGGGSSSGSGSTGGPDGSGSNGNTQGGPPSMPSDGQSGNSSASIAAGSVLTITDASGNVLISSALTKGASYVLFSSPKLIGGSSYTMASDGTAVSTLTASTSVTN